MIIIGEKINATRKGIAAAIAAREAQHLIDTAIEQVAAGARYLDVNGGDPKPETETANMEWLTDLIQAHVEVPLCIDSANPQAMEVGLVKAKAKPIVNSISLESHRFESFLPIVSRHECMVIGLCLDDGGMPCGVEDRVERAERLIDQLTGAGKAIDEIIVDPCFYPASAQPESTRHVCQAIAEIRKRHPGVHVGGGLSNVSFGLPARRHVNQAMLAAAIYSGMDVALIDPCTPGTVPLILASEIISGADEWCTNYVAAYREGKIQ